VDCESTSCPVGGEKREKVSSVGPGLQVHEGVRDTARRGQGTNKRAESEEREDQPVPHLNEADVYT
jgi:hypothetical protein